MNSNLSITVIMATFNGSDYIEEQLLSLKNQTHKKFSLTILDDCSMDNTVEIINRFIMNNNLYNWKLNINDTNIGWRSNFKKLLTMTDSDIIFFCDQDDIWELDKIEKMVNVFQMNNNVNVLLSDYSELIENGGIKQPPRKIKTINKNREKNLEKVLFSTQNWFNARPGCCMAFRNDVRNLILNLISKTNDAIPHDAATYLIGEITDSLYLLPENLITWRKFGNSSFMKEKSQNINNLQVTEYIKNQLFFSNKLLEFVRDYETELKKYNFTLKEKAVLEKINYNRYIISNNYNQLNLFSTILILNKFDNRSEAKNFILSKATKLNFIKKYREIF